MLRNSKLLSLWKAVETCIEAATLLPSPTRDGEEGGKVESYQEWIEHNELGLALDEMEMIGEVNDVPDQYWLELEGAARLMNLQIQAERCASRAGRVR